MAGRPMHKAPSFYGGKNNNQTKQGKSEKHQSKIDGRYSKLSAKNKAKLDVLEQNAVQALAWQCRIDEEDNDVYYSQSLSANDPFSLYRKDYKDSVLDLTCSGMSNEYMNGKRRATFVVIGHVDSGKSTTIGHLLCLSGNVNRIEIERIENEVKQKKKMSFKYAWILDKLKAERERGNTINTAYGKVTTTDYDCTVIDAPGHRGYIQNTITATSQADCALLIIDSTTGAFEAGISNGGQTREHALLALALGVKQMICCCNKMDATIPRYSKTRYDKIVKEVLYLLLKIGFNPKNITFLPISGYEGDDLYQKSTNLAWYDGPTLFQALDKISPPKRPINRPLRVPIQDIYRIGGIGTVPVGRVATGVLKTGMVVSFGPTGVTSEVNSVEMDHNPRSEAYPGDTIGFNVNIDVKDLKSGYVASDFENDPAKGAASFTSHIVIMNYPGRIKKGYVAMLDCHTAHTAVKVDTILSKIDRRSGKELEREPEFLEAGDAAFVKIIPTKPLVVETLEEYQPLGRFVLRDRSQTVALGVITSVDKYPT